MQALVTGVGGVCARGVVVAAARPSPATTLRQAFIALPPWVGVRATPSSASSWSRMASTYANVDAPTASDLVQGGARFLDVRCG